MPIRAGRYFVHEHPTAVGSWALDCMKLIMEDSRNWRVRMHMCAFGMVDRDGKPVKKASTFVTNSVQVAYYLNKTCPGHVEHQQLVGGRAHEARIC